VGSSYDAFSDRRVPWHEWRVSVGRTTPIGPIRFTGSRADRFALQDEQVEIEASPRFGPGTSATLSAAYSPDAVLYPNHRSAADLHQRIGAGFEASAGFRRIVFGRGVNVYAASLSKYAGPWLFSGRAFVAPSSEGPSRSYEGSFRRYFGGAGTFVGLRYSQGGWREELRDRRDLAVIDSNVGAAEATFIVGRVEINVTGAYTREESA
jgi:YaiO family outer membrane protein